MFINVLMIILSIDYENNNEIVVLLDEEDNIVRSVLINNNIVSHIKQLLKDYLKTPNIEWVNTSLVDIMPEERSENLNIVYGCIIPNTIESNCGKWTYLSKVKDGYVKETIIKNAGKILSGR